jgi:hypothetical protein
VSDSGNHKLNYKLSAMEWEWMQGGFEQASQELAKSTIITRLITRLLESNWNSLVKENS